MSWRLALMCAAAVGLQAGTVTVPVPLSGGMIIRRSTTVRPGRYELSVPSDPTKPAITIRGNDIVVDFNGAELAGGPDARDPDTYAGVAVFVDGGSRVTIRNAVIRGYKVGILARRSPDLHLTGNDLSHNWKQRLYSGIEKESLVDWMSYHQNQNDEWLRYGAGIYLSECDRAEIDHNTAVQGQNGLMVTRSSGLRIWNNTFQFLSGIGVGFYRVSRSTVRHNRIDWCVRGYSHGFYNRGQDSAGLLMYEQSSDNLVAYNSITHGGDGVFLWAGQSTMDTGEGGSNDNFFYGNDFSHAPTNGIEATFSRNRFVANRVEECWHGVWGGYSYDSSWIFNRFARNSEAIAIEHGQNNEILNNTFEGDEIGIRLWQNPTQDPGWGYPKHRDTRSARYRIEGNQFSRVRTAIDLADTRDALLLHNTYHTDVPRVLHQSGDTQGLRLNPEGGYDLRDPGLIPPPPREPEGIDPMIKDGERRGRDTIIVDEWGPYDWKSPKLWPDGKEDHDPLTLRVLGPQGEWKLAGIRGATLSSPSAGRVPGELVVRPTARSPVDFAVALDYRGVAVVSPRGVRTPAGTPYRFEYARFFVPIDWRVRFFEYTEATNPLTQADAFRTLLAGSPVKTVSTRRLGYVSGRSLEDGVARDRFALVAEGIATLPSGDYTVRVISDDGVRVWMDDRLILDSWTPHESRVDEVTIPGGRRTFRVEYYEVGGFAELRFDIQKRVAP